MAVFESHYKELGFYAKDSFKKFKNGRYVTDDKDEIAALEKLADVRKVEEEKPAKPAEEKAESKQAPKPKRKAPAKSSDK